MLLGSIYDNVMLKTKYRDAKLSFLYNVMIGQKHRMLYYKKLKRKYLEKVTTDRPWETLEKKANRCIDPVSAVTDQKLQTDQI